MPGGDTSNGQSGAVAPPSSTFHQITPPKYLDLKHSGEIAENWKLWKENITVNHFSFGSGNPGVSVGDVQTYDRR